MDEPVDVLGYVTLDEANTYVSEHYMSTEPFRQSWEALDPADKAVLLRRAFQAIEMLPFSGRKTCCSQQCAFPRWPSKEVPNAVKYAQIEQALEWSDADSTSESRQYEKMKKWGISSYSIGNLSETMGGSGYLPVLMSVAGITSTMTLKLLYPFIQGGYKIR